MKHEQLEAAFTQRVNLFQAEAAAHGMSALLDDNTAVADWPREKLLSCRNEARRLVNIIRDKAFEGKRELSNDELSVMSHASDMVQRMNTYLECQDGVAERHGVANGENYRDLRTGKVVSAISRDMPAAQALRISGTADYGLHEFLAGIAGSKASQSVRNVLAEGTDSAGGYTVPEILMPGILDAIVAESALLQAGARILPLAEQSPGGVFRFAKVATIPTATFRLENADFAESDATFDKVDFVPQTVGVVMKMSIELLQDGAGIERAVRTALAQSIAAAIDNAALNGSGTAPNPRGLLNMSLANSVSMGTNGLAIGSYDPFIDAMALTEADNVPVSSWTGAVLAPRTMAAIRKLKEGGTNAPLRAPDVMARVPLIPTSRMPIDQTQGSSSLASSIIAGDFRTALFGMRKQLSIVRLDQPFMTKGQIGFLAYARFDFQVLQPERLAVVVGVL